MRTNIVYVAAFLLTAALALSRCNDTEIDIDKGNGAITFENQSYPLNIATMTTSGDEGGGYTHSLILTHTNDGSYAFDFSVSNQVAENTIGAGSYKTTFAGDTTAHFKVNDEGDFLTGTMRVTLSDDMHTFIFEGTTVDENTPTKTVRFSYTGRIGNN